MKRRAFSLIEALLTLALTGALLAIASNLMANYADALRFSSTRDASFLALQASLDRVGREVRGSFSVSSPAPGSSAAVSTLTYQVLHPSFNTWLPQAVPSPVPGSWDPQPPAQVVTVSLFLDSQNNLVRQEGSETSNLANGLSDFQVRRVGSSSLEIVLTFQDTGGARKYKARVFRTLP